MTTLAASSALDHLRVKLSADIGPGLSAAAAERVLQSLIDLIAVAQIPLLVIPMDPRDIRGSKFPRVPTDLAFTLRGETQFVWWPAGQAAAVIQSKAIQIEAVSYKNPAEITAAVSADPAAVAEIMRLLLEAGPARSILKSKAKIAQLEALAEEVLLSATVDEKFHLKEQARVNLGISEQKLMQERLATMGKQLEVVERLLSVLERAEAVGIRLPARLQRDQVVQLLDNSRIIDTFATLDVIDPQIEVKSSGD